MSDIFEQLASPFDPSEVDWRVGSMTKDKDKGMALAYIDARTVMDRLDTVCGPAGWQCRYVLNGTKTVCELAVKCGDEWVWKSDGAGDSDIEAEKGALSDAFKRAAVRWGVGRYLYNLKSPWVAVRPFGKSYVISDEAKPQLDALLRRDVAKPEAKPVEKKQEPSIDERTKKFVNDSLEAIAECATMKSLKDWIALSEKGIVWVKANRPDEFAYIDGAIEERQRILERLA